MKSVQKSNKLNGVCYDIRGDVLAEAERLERQGYKILKLNIGNPAVFGFDAPNEMREDLIANLSQAQGYSQSKGVFSARKAVMHESQRLGIADIGIEDIYLGNGVSELILMAMNALLNNGDEVLIPMPDYPLWTAAVHLSGARAMHYFCDEQNNWQPDLDDIEAKISDRTKAIVIINPNNPTGAVYSKEVLQALVDLAQKHGLVIYSDEIYDKIIYEDAEHIPTATLVNETLCVTFNGLSKSYRSAGFRSGWMYLSGEKKHAQSYIEGLNMLASMRLCANAPGQYAIQTALGGYQSIKDLVLPGGRLREQRDLSYDMIQAVEGLSVVKPMGALYLFVKLDTKRFNITNDERFVIDFLREKHILLVHGRAFNWPQADHFRVVTLPHKTDLRYAFSALTDFLSNYKQN